MLIVEVLAILGVLFGTVVLVRLLSRPAWGFLLWLVRYKPKPTEPSDLLQQVNQAKARAAELQDQYDKQQKELKIKSEELEPLTDKGSDTPNESGH